MARFQQGFGFSGKLGNVVGVISNGKFYLRSIPRKSHTAPSKAQQEQREKFKTVIHFLKPFVDIVGGFFQVEEGKGSSYNAAMKYNYHFALQGGYPNFCINYHDAAVTYGRHPGIRQGQVSVEAGGVLRFSWQYEGRVGAIMPDDEMILVVYNPFMHEVIYAAGAAKRSDEVAAINAEAFTGRHVHCWISCYNVRRNKVARSTYLGEVLVMQ